MVEVNPKAVESPNEKKREEEDTKTQEIPRKMEITLSLSGTFLKSFRI